MNLSNSPQLYKIARVLALHGGPEVAAALGLQGGIAEGRAKRAERLASDLERLGPTFVKFGQILASRPDIVPDAVRLELARLHSAAVPIPPGDVEGILSRELGPTWQDRFRSFQQEPLAAASIGQVHRATLASDGRLVVVKVQRPGIRASMISDLEALATLASMAEAASPAARELAPTRIIAEVRSHLLKELSYDREINNLKRLRASLGSFDRIRVPEPIAAHSTSRVLCMEFIEGEALDTASVEGPLGIELADALFHAYLHQIIVEGFFHADPHPGNIRLLPDGGLAILDLGMVGLVPKRLQRGLVKLLLALADGRAEDAAEVFVDLAPDPPEATPRQFIDRVTEFLLEVSGSDVGGMEVGRTLVELQREANKSKVSVPPVLVLLGKALLQLEQIAKLLDPGFRPDVAVRKHTASLFQATLDDNFTPSRLLQTALEADELMSSLPRQIGRAVKTLADNEARLDVRIQRVEEFPSVVAGSARRLAAAVSSAGLTLGGCFLVGAQSSVAGSVLGVALIGLGGALGMSSVAWTTR